jgi:hypothetical protein
MGLQLRMSKQLDTIHRVAAREAPQLYEWVLDSLYL